MRQTFGVWDEVRNTAADAAVAREDGLPQHGNQDYDDSDGPVHGGGDQPPMEDDLPPMDNGFEYNSGDELDWGDPDAMDRETAAELERIQEVSRIPLFEGSPLSGMEATILLLNQLRGNNASNVQVDQTFALLHRVILPQPNTLPDSEYGASQVLRKLGLEFQCIDVCANNCVLFRGVHSDSILCPTCASPRRRRHGKSLVPVKILRHFPLGVRIKRMYRSPLMAASLTWIGRERPADGMVRHVSQSKHMADIREREPEFCNDPRRLFLALSTDGMNPFSEKRSVYSTWPVTLFNYNLPPWMTTKRYCIILSLIIPGPKAPSSDHFDVLIEPLVEELEMLWHEGMMLEDASRFRGERYFLMRAMLIFCIHDFPAYGMVAGQVTKGYHACPVCGPNTLSRRSQFLKKNVYDNQARRHLPPSHPLRSNSRDFGGSVEFTGAEVLQCAQEREHWLNNGGQSGAPGDPVRTTGVKRKSILFRLPYWEVPHPTPYHHPHVHLSVFPKILFFNVR